MPRAITRAVLIPFDARRKWPAATDDPLLPRAHATSSGAPARPYSLFLEEEAGGKGRALNRHRARYPRLSRPISDVGLCFVAAARGHVGAEQFRHNCP